MQKSIKSYVCPNCFRQIDHCTCEYPPFELIGVDEGIQKAVRICDLKGYVTTGSCESHYTEPYKPNNMYIQFDSEYAPDTAPEGWNIYQIKLGHYKTVNVSYTIKRKSKIEEKAKAYYEEQKQIEMEKLIQWAKQLPERVE